ncbi:pseudouridine synthase [Sediminicola sp. YIK13]|uniref:tRNA pseudouridine(38-40) synthase TruA n=1 Tax=Sediminicola sp. YIK13 TaxID=1453352 RepID=UPI00071F5267|nr:tRNA pseudouridine(38-40) synthase TruA [Sediminicola sp. YIK13]ALM07122.1 pseudouridine synthase [Sediminicola sp. YIK13]
MQKERYYYLIELQFLGFRYSGWQKQPGQKTIESMLLKTLKFILPERKFKILGAGRTDAKVSALHAAFELFLDDAPLNDLMVFKALFNRNLPPDIRITSILSVDKDFNVIQHSKEKEYVYLFSYGQKNHPFSAPFIANIQDDLDLGLMTKATSLFVGSHDFRNYTTRHQENTNSKRRIKSCLIQENTILKANFFPEKSYALHIVSEGFMRYQVRMIMGALILLGKGELSLNDIEESLKPDTAFLLSYVAPGSGLLLNRLDFQ